jgi:hypothetical protein
MIRSLRIAHDVTALVVLALVLAALPVVASAQGGHQLNDATSIGIAHRCVLFVGRDSTAFQKVEITWVAPPAPRTAVPRQAASARSTDTDRTGAASIKFVRAVNDDSKKVQGWLQRGTTLEPVHVNLLDDKGKVVSTMTAPWFKADKWSINNMDAGASQVAVEVLQVSTPALHVQGPGFGD